MSVCCDQGLQLPSSKQLSESAAKSKGGCESLTVWQTLDSEQSSIPDSGINNPSKPPRLGFSLVPRSILFLRVHLAISLKVRRTM